MLHILVVWIQDLDVSGGHELPHVLPHCPGQADRQEHLLGGKGNLLHELPHVLPYCQGQADRQEHLLRGKGTIFCNKCVQ